MYQDRAKGAQYTRSAVTTPERSGVRVEVASHMASAGGLTSGAGFRSPVASLILHHPRRFHAVNPFSAIITDDDMMIMMIVDLALS